MVSRQRLCYAAGLAALAVIAATGLPGRAHVRMTTALSWDRDIAPIVQARCVTCHRADGRAPMSLATYDAARPWARAIRHQVVTRQMPKWHAARGYGEFANDPSLSPFEIALIAAWVDGGAPRTIAPKPGAPPVPASPSPPTLRPFQPPATRIQYTAACGDALLPTGQLLGVQPRVTRGESIRVIATLPNGTSHNLGWFRDVDPDFAQTYWLRTPVDLPPNARLISEPESAGCGVTLTYGR